MYPKIARAKATTANRYVWLLDTLFFLAIKLLINMLVTKVYYY